MDEKKLEYYAKQASVYEFAEAAGQFTVNDKKWLQSRIDDEISVEQGVYSAFLDVYTDNRKPSEDELTSLIDFSDTVADYTEKALALSASYDEYRYAADVFTDTEFSLHDLWSSDTERIFTRHGKYLGTLGRDLQAVSGEIEKMFPVVRRWEPMRSVIILLVCTLGAAALFFVPAVVNFFEGSWVPIAMAIVGGILFIFLWCLYNFVKACIIDFLIALVVAFFGGILGVGLMIRIVLTLILAFLVFAYALVLKNDLAAARKAKQCDPIKHREEIEASLKRLEGYTERCLRRAALITDDEAFINGHDWIQKYYQDIKSELEQMRKNYEDRK